MRTRVTALARETRYPREDVISLQGRVDAAVGTLKELQAELHQAQRGMIDDLRRAQSTLTGDIAHTRQLLNHRSGPPAGCAGGG